MTFKKNVSNPRNIWAIELAEELKELDRHYIGSRYPNFYPSGAPYKFYTREVAERCLSYAGSILSEVRKFLKS